MELAKKKAKAKSEKLFRFQSFTERIASIKINATHQIRTYSDVPDEHETFFGTGLQKWRELNCTSNFVDFHREVVAYSNSLAQLVHHKDELITALLHHLQTDNTLAYEPLLDLVVQLARDLQSDFYPHFSSLFPVIVSVCVCHDAQLIQHAFTALAHLFKFLWRHMLRDIANVYRLYSELLVQSQKPHIRQFASESFGFLLRKVQDYDKLLDMIFSSLAENPQLTEGVGQLLFEVCRGVPKQFHSCTEKLMMCSLEKLSSPSLTSDLVFQSLSHTVQLMTEHTRREFSQPLWNPLLSHLQSLLPDWEACPESSPLSRNLVHTLHLVGVAVAWRKGSRIMDVERIIKIAETILSPSNSLTDSLISVSLHLVTSLMLVSTAVTECHTHFSRLLWLLCVRRGCGEVEIVLKCFRELAEKHLHFTTNILPECLKYCTESCSAEQNHTHVIHFLVEICLTFDPKWAHPDSETPAGDISTPVSAGGKKFVLQCVEENEILKTGINSLKLAASRSREQLDNALKVVIEAGLVVVCQREGVGEVSSEGGEEERWRDGLATTWAALVCVQYIRPVSQSVLEVVQTLNTTLKDTLCQTTPTSPHHSGDQEQLLVVWSQAVSTLCSTLIPEKLMERLNWSDFILLLQLRPTSPLLLSAAVSFLSNLSPSLSPSLSSSLSLSPSPSPSPSPHPSSPPPLQHVLPLLQSNLCSPSSHVRVLTLKLFSCCLSLDTGDTMNTSGTASDTGDAIDTGDAGDGGAELVESCLKAELVPAILTEYREKLLWLERLKYHPHRFSTLPPTYHEIPLRYLIGSLYVNFSLLWEPIKDLVNSYAVEDKKKLFWDVFGSLLEEASNLSEDPPLFTPPSEVLHWHDSIPALSQYQHTLVCGMERGRPDHANFRRLLWKCLYNIPAFAEPRSRILVPLFLQFIEREYVLKEDNLMEFQDLRKMSENDSPDKEEDGREEVQEGEGGEGRGEGETRAEGRNGERGEEVLEDMEMDVEEGECLDGEREGRGKKQRGSAVKKRSAHRKRKDAGKPSGSRGLTKILVEMLSLFSKFQNPKALYRQEDLHKIYMKLLTHKDTTVQQLAIDCLMTYKPPHLIPYYENLERLLENASFREELLNLNTDSSCCVVSEEHRANFLPILIRILYGRIQRPFGAAVSRVGVASRRTAVLQFLASCEGTEMEEFFSLLLLPFHGLLDSSDSSPPEVDISRVIPLKKQFGFLTMLAQIISVLGPLIEPHLHTFLTVLLRLAHCHHTILDNRLMIQPEFVMVVRGLRQLVITRLIECFQTFTTYDFSPFEDEVYNSVVWPQLFKLPNESIQHPTPLMKLIITWSKFPRYHELLSRPVPKHVLIDSPQGPNNIQKGPKFPPGGTAVLYYVYQCLFSPGVGVSVVSSVLEMTLDLLDAREAQTTDVELEEEAGHGGVRLVSSFIPTLLTYLGGKVRARGEQAEGEGGNMQLEFSVLSRISDYVKDAAECSALISLLLPFASASKYKKYQDRILDTIEGLLGSVDEVNTVFRPLSRLFCEVTTRKNRSTLCKIFKVLASKEAGWKKTADIVAMLNEWDSKHIEEPAYETRQEGYAAAKTMLAAKDSWTVNCVLPVLYNALFTLNMSEEMSLRDAAASFITHLLTNIQTNDGEKFNYVVMNVVMTAVKQGLRAKTEFARLEFVSLLSSLVKCYPHHPKFSDMATHLTHEDKEVDFFENICHVQLHRRTKAMRKLACACKDGLLGPHSMTGLLVPFANQVIFHSTSNVEQNLVAESVNVISGMCLHLKWTKYCYLLRHYLRLLTKKGDIQKTLIRVVVGILNAFHFDVSDTSPTALSENNRDEKRGKEEWLVDRGKASTPEGVIEVLEERGSEEKEGDVMELEEDGERGEVGEEEEGGCNQTTHSSHQLQQKIHNTIVQSILPSLDAILTKGSSPTPTHKLSTKFYDQDAHMLRVPIAMAITKLLLHLPQSALTTHLPGLLLKVCETLKNRSCDVRDTARDTLVKMAAALGPSYLPYIVKEMTDLLTRGYQLHVLAYSLHSILNGASSILKTGDLDPCLQLISQILQEDLFGVPAEEREAGESVARIPESKRPQSCNSYRLVAQFLSPRLLPQLLAPVKEILDTKASSRTCHVVEDVFRCVGYGILANDGFTPQAILMFVHGLVSDAIPQLSTKPRLPPSSNDSMLLSRRPVDSRLIAKEPGRAKPKPATQANIAAHIVTEFGLQVLRTAFKRGKFDNSSTEQLQMLDPFLPLLTSSLSSRHSKVLTHSLHCLLPLLRSPLPSLATNVHRIVTGLFGVLRKYARAGEMNGANRELVIAAFKAMTVVLRDVKQAQISEDELKLLLGYVEEDIHDYQRQLTAFPLLRAILGRKLVVEDIHKLMYKIAQLSVTSDSDTTRQQCRQAVVHYIMDYPLGKKLKRILDFYVCNLSYDDQNGRESVIEFFSLIFTKFPDLLIHRYATFFFIPLSSQLANDDSPTCKRMIAEVLSSLFKRLNSSTMNDVITMVKGWMIKIKLSHRRLGIQILGLLAEVLGRSFEAHLPIFLPLLSECLHMQHEYSEKEEGEGPISMGTSTDVVSMVTKDEAAMVTEETDNHCDLVTRAGENGVTGDRESVNEEGLTHSDNETETLVIDERSLDHFLFGVVQVLCKVFSVCVVGRSPVHRSTVNCILDQVECLLLHPHSWVRLASSQLFGHLFAAYQPDDLVPVREAAAASEEGGKERRRKRRKSAVSVMDSDLPPEYLLKDPSTKVPDLCHSFCVQLNSPLLTPDLATQAVKNLVFLAKSLHRLMEAGHMTSEASHVTVQSGQVTLGDKVGNNDVCGSNTNSHIRGDESTLDDHYHGDESASSDCYHGDKSTPDDRNHGDDSVTEHGGHRRSCDLHWLVERLSRLARYEAGRHPQQSLKRTSVLQWTAVISLDLGSAHLPAYLPLLLATPYREMTDANKTAGEDLYTLACEVVEVMKGVCGREEFARGYSAAHRRALGVREKRRKQAALEAVVNPEKMIRRRQKKHLLTRASKRRRILLHRPSATSAKKLQTRHKH